MNQQEDQDQLIFGYPTEKKQIISLVVKDRIKPTIVVQRSKPPEIQFTYDKKTFDYSIMFFAIESHESPEIAWRANQIELHENNQVQLNSRSDLLIINNASSLYSDIQRVEYKPNNNEQESPQWEINQDSRKDDQSSLWINKEQADKKQSIKSQSDQGQSQQNHPYQRGPSEQIIKDSLIQGLSAEMELLQAEKQQKYSVSIEPELKIKNSHEEQQKQEAFSQENLILKDLHKEIQQDLEQNARRKQKIKQTEHAPFQNLWYQIKSQNCSQVSIKTLSSDDFPSEKITSPSHQNQYFALKQKKLIINSYSNEGTLWKMGISKINFQPIMINLKCYSCRKKIREVLVVGNESYTLCSNRQCTKQIVVEFTRSYFGRKSAVQFNQ